MLENRDRRLYLQLKRFLKGVGLKGGLFSCKLRTKQKKFRFIHCQNNALTRGGEEDLRVQKHVTILS